jgi:hypothetical protein
VRRMTDEEARWLSSFDYTYNRMRTKQKKYLQDTMRGIRVDNGREIEDLSDVLEGESHVVSSISTSKRKIPGENGNQPYTAHDYWALPSIWYTNRWDDKVIAKLDAEKEFSEIVDIPGIVEKGNKYYVSSFFNQEKVSIGIYSTLEEAKEALIRYNTDVTKRGWGYSWT